MSDSTNLSTWNKHGNNLLVVQPYMDNVIVSGEGSYMIDQEGNRILDMAAGQFCNVLGYSNQTYIDAIQAQVRNLVHVGDQYIPESVFLAASNVADITPGDLNKILFLSTGSEANECAMRIAKTVTQRSGMLAYSRGYYGITLATRGLSTISDANKTDFQPVPVGQQKLLTPTCGHCPLGLTHPECELRCLETSVAMNEPHLQNIAAIIIEPIISAGGMIVPPIDYIKKLAALAKSIGALLIVDEAQTGFGRCGTWFDIEHYDVQPDMLVFSKTSGNGYPVSGIAVSEAIAKTLEEKGFTHLSSHQNDPIAAAAVNAVIKTIREDNLLDHVKEVGTHLVSGLRKLQEKHDSIVDVRGRGLMIGMEISDDVDETFAFDIAMFCEQAGLHITYTYFEPVIRFIPPLIITKNEIDEALHILDKAFSQKEKLKSMSKGPQNHRSGPFVRRLNNKYSPGRIIKKLWTTSPSEIVQKIRDVST